MAVKLRVKRPDARLKQIAAALDQYAATHPQAQIEVYRQDAVSIRARVIDPDFAALTWSQREDDLWNALKPVPDDVVAELSVLLLLTPEEAAESFANVEFDNPTRSRL